MEKLVPFDIISDIHLEKDLGKKVKLSQYLPLTCSNLIIAGDITQAAINWDALVSFLAICCDRYKHVIYVLGNHEYYNKNINMNEIKSKIKELMKIHANLVVLDDEYILDKDNGLIIYGATLWSCMPNNKFSKEIPIYIEGKLITASQWNKLHKDALEKFLGASRKAEELGCRLVVITHYAPLVNEALDPKHHGMDNNVFYCTDLKMIYPLVRTWIFGHTGHNCEFKRGTTTFISNQYQATNFQKKTYWL